MPWRSSLWLFINENIIIIIIITIIIIIINFFKFCKYSNQK